MSRDRVEWNLIRPTLDRYQMRARNQVSSPGIHGLRSVFEVACRDKVDNRVFRHVSLAVPLRGPSMDSGSRRGTTGIAERGREQTMIAKPAPIGILASKE